MTQKELDNIIQEGFTLVKNQDLSNLVFSHREFDTVSFENCKIPSIIQDSDFMGGCLSDVKNTIFINCNFYFHETSIEDNIFINCYIDKLEA